MDKVKFIKMVGTGNDFIVIDRRKGTFPLGDKQLPCFVRDVCRRRCSVGADGVLLVEDTDSGDVAMRVFNPDGQEVDMCGNGARCVAFCNQTPIS